MLKYLLPLVFALALTPAIMVVADDAAQAVLEEHDLSLQGNMYVLADEREITRSRRELQTAERNLQNAERDFRRAERRIDQAKAYIAQLQAEIDELRSRARRSDTQREADRHISALEEKAREIENAQAERQEYEDEQQQLIDDSRAAYLTKLFEIAEQVKALSDQYAELAEEQAVTDAIAAEAQETERPYTLGPTRAFQSMRRSITLAAEEHAAGVVDLRKEGNILMIDVRINGNPIRSMILDTGASTVSLPFMFAKDLGIEPSDDTPQVQVQMADGKIVDAWRMTLDSVQVGQFLIRDVECLVLPEELHAAPALLGNSFLGNFTFNVDPERGKLLLSQIDHDEDEDE